MVSVQLREKDIAEFKHLYKKHFNIELDDFDARDKLSKLVHQMEIVYQPIAKKQLKEYQERTKDEKTKNL